MNLNPLDLWASLAGMPWPIALAVLGLTLFLIAALLVMPLVMMVMSEPGQTSGWFLAQRKALAQVQSRGAGLGETYLRAIAMSLELVNITVGYFVAWLALFMVLTQFVVVIMRYVFSYGSIQMQESIWYMHGILFMLGAGYTLLKDGHVRVDIFYREGSVRRKALVNLWGVVLFLLPLCYITWLLSWSYVANAWSVREGSTEVSGLPFIYLFKTVILVFIALMVSQGLSLALRSLMILTGMQWVDGTGGSPDSDYQGSNYQGSDRPGTNFKKTD